MINIKSISICQSCNINFDSSNHIPYLFKCGHFFCKKCINNKFLNKQTNKIECPEDKIENNSFNDLKVLNNLIIDNYNESEYKEITIENEHKRITKSKVVEKAVEKPIEKPFENTIEKVCKIHQNQKLGYYIENTNELICIYCAYLRVKRDPNLDIQELNEKCLQFKENIGKILMDHQDYINKIEEKENNLYSNYEQQNQKINDIFSWLATVIEDKKKVIFNKLEQQFNENIEKLKINKDKLIKQLQEVKKVNYDIESFDDNQNFFELLSKYNNIYTYFNKNSHFVIELEEINIVNNRENDFVKFLNRFIDSQSNNYSLAFLPKHSENSNKKIKQNYIKENPTSIKSNLKIKVNTKNEKQS